MIQIRRALLSVSDKAGLLDLAEALHEKGVQLIASGGTANALQAAGLPVTFVEQWTGHPEAMEGRIKTVHPRIHGGILARRDHPGDREDLKRLGLEPIDLVVVNFYPFRQVLASGKPHDEIVEAIDVGGPSMVRAACKNSDYVVALTSPSQYGEFLVIFRENGGLPEEFSKRCAAEAFTAMVSYDSAIAEWLNSGSVKPLVLKETRKLRYGENPHQQASLFTSHGQSFAGLVASDQLAGKEMSYNNFLDADGALKLAGEFDEPAAIIIKHVTPCGVGISDKCAEALKLALETDRVSAFGGIVALNRDMDADSAAVISDIFLEIVLAPGFTPQARALLAKKKALRLITYDWKALRFRPVGTEVRQIWGGYLIQEVDQGLPELENLRVVTKRPPSAQELTALILAWKVCKHVRSNAIVFSDHQHTLGIGAGQMSRVDSANLAVRKAEAAHLSLQGSVCASDAFFPFRDGLDVAAEAGATAMIQPGGSVRDEEVIAAADEHELAMVFTGRRHFRH